MTNPYLQVQILLNVVDDDACDTIIALEESSYTFTSSMNAVTAHKVLSEVLLKFVETEEVCR